MNEPQKEKIVRKSFIYLFIFLALIIFLKLINIQDIILKKIYVKDYSEYVYKYATDYNLDPLLVFAVIKTESNFKVDATSSSNAIGLMQLMENTALEVSNNINEKINSKEELYNPEINIKLGAKYLSELLERYDNNLNMTLAAYNAGIGNVTDWVKKGIIKADGSDIENIPFKETNNYVRKILRDYKMYKKIYEK